MSQSERKCLKADELGCTYLDVLNREQVIVKETSDPETAALLENEYRMLLKIGESCLPQASLFPKAVRLTQGENCVLTRSFIPGDSLEALVEGRENRPGLPPEQAVRYAKQILDLLSFLHSLEPPVIQRDIKPQNIIVDEDDRCHIIDMGISRELTDTAGRDTRIFGTPMTAPPEQFGYRQTDRRSDIYSVGVLLNYMLTGEYQLDQPELDRDLHRVIRKAAAFDPKDRYQAADEMIRALNRLVSQRKQRRWLLPAAVLLSGLALLFSLLPHRAGQKAVRFQEPLIEQAVRIQLNKPEEALTPEDLETIEQIHIYGRLIYEDDSQFWFLGDQPYARDGSLNPALWSENGGIVSLRDVSLLPNLQELCLYHQSITDLSPLRGTKLTGLGLGYNPIADLSSLSGCSSLVYLNLACLPADISETLSTLPSLARLNLSGVPVKSLRSLEALPLTELNLYGIGEDGAVDKEVWRSLSRIRTLKKLTINKLDWNILDVLVSSTVTDLEVTHANGIPFGELQRIKGLRSLYFYSDDHEIIGSDAFDFPELSWLDIKNVELESLVCFSGLTKLKTLHLYASTCLDVHGLEALPELKEIYCTPEQKAVLQEHYPQAVWQYY